MNTATKPAIKPTISKYVWNYIRTLGVDRDTAYDLYQEAQAAVWQAATQRATDDCQAYLVKTAIGAMRHWLRDKYGIIRVPAYLHDRGEAKAHVKTILPLDDVTDSGDGCFEEDSVDRIAADETSAQIQALLPRLSKSERAVMEFLFAGLSIKEIAAARGVRCGCVYAQFARARTKLRKWMGVPEPPRRKSGEWLNL